MKTNPKTSSDFPSIQNEALPPDDLRRWITAHQLGGLVRKTAQAIWSFETGGLVNAQLESGNDALRLSNFKGVLHSCAIGEFSIDAVSRAQIEKNLPEALWVANSYSRPLAQA